MTPKQLETFDFIKKFMDEKNYSPSYREIGEGINTTPASAYRMTVLLIEQGLITIIPERARSIKIVEVAK